MVKTAEEKAAARKQLSDERATLKLGRVAKAAEEKATRDKTRIEKKAKTKKQIAEEKVKINNILINYKKKRDDELNRELDRIQNMDILPMEKESNAKLANAKAELEIAIKESESNLSGVTFIQSLYDNKVDTASNSGATTSPVNVGPDTGFAVEEVSTGCSGPGCNISGGKRKTRKGKYKITTRKGKGKRKNPTRKHKRKV